MIAQVDYRRVPNVARIGTLIEDRSVPGRILGVDRRKLREQPFLLGVDSPNQSLSMGANGSSNIGKTRVSAQGPAEIVALGVKATGACVVMAQVADGQSMLTLMNGPIHVDTVFGNNLLPFRLSEALYIDNQRSVDWRFTDISGSSNAARLVAHAVRYMGVQFDPRLQRIRQRMAEKQYISAPFWYTNDTGAITITASSTATGQISIAPDHSFELMKITASATSGLYDLNLINVSRGKSLINAPGNQNYSTSAGLWVGTAQYPYIFPEPVLFEAGEKILINLTDRSGSDNVIYLTLHGRIIASRMWH